MINYTRLLKKYCLLVICLISLSACEDDSTNTGTQSVTIAGKSYAVVTIGSQTWTTANYAGPGGVSFDDANSKPEYGKYYTKAEVDAIALPEGWRIPTQLDYVAMAEYYEIDIPAYKNPSIKSLASTTHWNNATGTNGSGFNAYPAGYIFGSSDPIDGDIAEFWTAEGLTLSIQEAGEDLSSFRILFYENSDSPEYRFNVRFVKDN